MTAREVARAHRRWVDDLLDAAQADGAIDVDEYDALCRAAAILSIDQAYVDDRTTSFRTGAETITLGACRVCFTGEPVDSVGSPIVRDRLKDHARSIGMTPVDSVTMSHCDLLVAADPGSKSGKAKKARSYGIPIVSAADFLNAKPGTRLEAQSLKVADRQTYTCPKCGKTWSRPKQRTTTPLACPECASKTPDPKPAARRARSQGAQPTTEALTCGACGATFQRTRTRGRTPTRCTSCRTA